MKIVSCILLTFFTTLGWAQPNQVIKKVIYKVGVYGKNTPDQKDTKSNITNTSISDIEKSMMELEYTLLFNKGASVFKLLDKSYYDDFKYKMAITISGGDKAFYTDLEENAFYKKVNFSGQTILIKRNLDEMDWEIMDETKMVGSYKCVKATTKIEYYSKVKDVLLTFNPVVWFTYDIPVSFGPSNLVGLPGLVLEGTYNGKLYFYATEISKEETAKVSDLKVPRKGKVMDPEEYEEFLFKHGG